MISIPPTCRIGKLLKDMLWELGRLKPDGVRKIILFYYKAIISEET